MTHNKIGTHVAVGERRYAALQQKLRFCERRAHGNSVLHGVAPNGVIAVSLTLRRYHPIRGSISKLVVRGLASLTHGYVLSALRAYAPLDAFVLGYA